MEDMRKFKAEISSAKQKAFILLLLLLFTGFSGQKGGAAPISQSSIPLRLVLGNVDPLVTAPETMLSAEWRTNSSRSATTQYYIVQLTGPIHDTHKTTLQDMGVKLLDYIPHFSYVVQMSPETKPLVEALSIVRWVGNFSPGFRVDPQLMSESDSADLPQKFLVTSFPDADQANIAQQIAQAGASISEQHQDQWSGIFVIEATYAQLATLASIEGVQWIEPAPQVELFGEIATDLTGVTQVWDAPTPLGLHGTGQLIAVADTGIDNGSIDPAVLHEDFEDGSGKSRIDAIYDRSGDGAQDASWHGTHVAGIAVGNGARSGSSPTTHQYTGYSAGVAPEARLVFQAIARDNGTITGIPVGSLSYLFKEAYENLSGSAPVYIHSNSWGSPILQGIYDSQARQIDEYSWQNPEFTILFSAGNNGKDSNGDGITDLGSIATPSTAKNAITVGSSENYRPLNGTKSDNPAEVFATSGRGPTADGRIKPDLVAPGTEIKSVASGFVYAFDYVSGTGTSMATPHVAGAVGLLRQHFTNLNHTPTSALLKGMLVNGAKDLWTEPKNNVGASRPTPHGGWGRLDVAQTLGIGVDGGTMWWDNNASDSSHQTTPIGTGESAEYVIQVKNSAIPLHITLAWTDYPGSTLTNGALVNDLDLQLIAPDGTIYYPNNANPGDIADNDDHVNNLVGIDVANPSEGTYTIVVKGYNVPQGPQPYALVAGGGLQLLSSTSEPVATFSTNVTGAGSYAIGNSGLNLNVLSGSGLVTVYLHSAPPPYVAQDKSYYLARYYEIVVAEGSSIVADTTFYYAQSEFDGTRVSLEDALNIHTYQNGYWSGYQPTRRDPTNNTLTIDSLLLSGTTLWAFGPDVPTAVKMSSAQSSTVIRVALPLMLVAGLTILFLFKQFRLRRS